MTFSYTLPPASDNDRIRFLLSDTSEATHRVEDEEIDLAVAQFANLYYAAAFLAETLSARYTAKGTKTVGRLTIDYGAIGQGYSDLAGRLRGMADDGVVGGDYGPEVTGQSIGDIELVGSDTDRVPDYFSHGMHGAGGGLPSSYQG